MATRKGLRGAKPANLYRWLFDAMNLDPADDLTDIFPGTGGMMLAWDEWRRHSHRSVEQFAMDVL